MLLSIYSYICTMPRCLNCKDKFIQYQFNNKFCKDIDCQVKKSLYLVDKMQKQKIKQINKEVKVLKEKLKTKSDWLRDAQKVVNKYIRERDKNEPNCISCDKHINGVRHASHYMSSGGHSSVRFNTDNIWVSCYKCNVMLSGNLLQYRIRLIKKIGLKRVEYIETISKEIKRYSVDELKEIMIEFKEKIRQLKK